MSKLWIACKWFFGWIRSIHQEGTPDSSKKFYGGIVFLACAIRIIVSQPLMTETLLFCCVGMLGFEGLSNLFNKR